MENNEISVAGRIFRGAFRLIPLAALCFAVYENGKLIERNKALEAKVAELSPSPVEGDGIVAAGIE